MNLVSYFVKMIDSRHPFTYIDIGAMGGIPLKWRMILPVMKIIAFEPDTREFSKLKSEGNIQYFNYALNKESAGLKYYVSREAGKSSMLKPNMRFLSEYEDSGRFESIKEEVIASEKVRTLDSLIKDNLIKDVDFMKLDTQGSELFILQGAENKAMSKFFGAQIEVEFVEMYEGQPLFRDIDAFMDSKGFQLMDLKRMYWKRKDYYRYPGKGALVCGDALYFKKIDRISQELSEVKDKNYARSKILKSILACMIYEMFDYAVSLAKVASEQNWLEKDECDETIRIIKNYSLRGVPLFLHFNLRVYNIIETILQKFKPLSFLAWADADRYIGNIKDK